MRQEIAEKWLTYLDSKIRAKSIAIMRKNQGPARCPLGHLCDLYHQETGVGHWEQDYATLLWLFVDAQGAKGWLFPPIGVTAWAGLPDPNFDTPLLMDNITEGIAHISDITQGWGATKRNIMLLGTTGKLAPRTRFYSA